MAGRWLFKTEPTAYSFAQLQKDGRAVWDGVKNPQALKNLAAIAKGDAIFIYHTGDEKAVIGIAKATSTAYADPKQKNPALLVIDIAPQSSLKRAVTLAEIKADSTFAGWELVRLPRLSVMPVTEDHWQAVERLARS